MLRHIVFLAYDGFQLLDLAGPMQVFTTASAHAFDDRSALPVDYRTSVVSAGGGRTATPSGVTFDTGQLPDSLSEGTTLIVVGGDGVEAALSNTALMAWLKSAASKADRICSVCNGAFLLAGAGLLDGRKATTHWADCDALRQKHSKVSVHRDALYVRDGPVWTSAGASAGIDLALALVEDDHGPNAAAETARRLVLYVKRPGNQSQFSRFIDLVSQEDAGVFGSLHQWMIDNIAKTLSVPDLARQAGMSERTFARKYAARLGFTPAEGVNRLRAEMARQYLRSSRTSLKTIAVRTGFGSVEHMNRVHMKIFGVSSRLLRETV